MKNVTVIHKSEIIQTSETANLRNSLRKGLKAYAIIVVGTVHVLSDAIFSVQRLRRVWVLCL
eukprot:4010177-Amphidinium_carterae.1